MGENIRKIWMYSCILHAYSWLSLSMCKYLHFNWITGLQKYPCYILNIGLCDGKNNIIWLPDYNIGCLIALLGYLIIRFE